MRIPHFFELALAKMSPSARIITFSSNAILYAMLFYGYGVGFDQEVRVVLGGRIKYRNYRKIQHLYRRNVVRPARAISEEFFRFCNYFYQHKPRRLKKYTSSIKLFMQ